MISISKGSSMSLKMAIKIFFIMKKRVIKTIALFFGGRGWARAMLESSLATQAVALVVCGSHPPTKGFFIK